MIKLTDPYGKPLYVSADDVVALDTIVESSGNHRTLTRVHIDCSERGFFCALEEIGAVNTAVEASLNT